MKSKIERNLYSQEDELLCNLYYLNFHKVLIEFVHPEIAHILQDSIHFKSIFLNDTVLKLVEEIPELSIDYNLYKNTKILESIEILNIKSIKWFDFITFKVMELLKNEKEYGISTKIVREFYSHRNELLCHIYYLDYNRVFIRFAQLKDIKVDSQSDSFKKIFLSEIVKYLEDKIPDLIIDYKYYDQTTIIKAIEIINLITFEDYDFITAKIMDLLARIDKPYLFTDDSK
jgi:hypothetical protein